MEESFTKLFPIVSSCPKLDDKGDVNKIPWLSHVVPGALPTEAFYFYVSLRPLVDSVPDPVQEDSTYPETETTIVRRTNGGKKGTCYRCLKGNRFTEKEACIVCGAKYCSNCVLRAMGSMPEGRKCSTCIGFSIDEAKRGSLGKCSRMLKRLFAETEIRMIMESEISCGVNQLRPELVVVNGEALSQVELSILQGSPNPPKSLRQGEYWYDKVSGFWGKVGHAPCQIISAQLNVGGQIMKSASKGNTNVLVNGREITKKELLMLQSAGVQCEGNPHFWLSADGSYNEEGQNYIKGQIWDKTMMKLVCTILSLPSPPNWGNPSGDEGNDNKPNYQKCETLRKILLIGDVKSGTSTIYKQAKFLYNVPFSEYERQNMKSMIQNNLYRYLRIVLEGREQFEKETLTEKRKRQPIDRFDPSGQISENTIYSMSPRQKAIADWLLHVITPGNLEAIFPVAPREYAPFVEELWKDAAVQATYNRRSELNMLPRNATYFLEQVVEISRMDYEPTDMDMLHAEGIASSNGLSCMEFSFAKCDEVNFIDSFCENDSLSRYQLVRFDPRMLGDNCDQLEMFEDVDIVLFCVSLADYDEFSEDNNGVLTNKMLASKQLFQDIITHEAFKGKNFLLLLNKYDLLKEKIKRVPLTRCEWFSDFNPVIINNQAQPAFHYIAVKFKSLFASFTGRKLFVSLVTAFQPESVDAALRQAREIHNWEAEEINYIDSWSSDSDYDSEDSLRT